MTATRMYTEIDTTLLPVGHQFDSENYTITCEGETIETTPGWQRHWECRHGYFGIQGYSTYFGTCGFEVRFQSKLDVRYCTKKHGISGSRKPGSVRFHPPKGPHSVRSTPTCKVDEEYTAQVHAEAER